MAEEYDRIKEQDDKNFQKLRERNSDSNKKIIRDGIVDPEKYFNHKHIQILYLLKEPNDDQNNDFDLRDVIKGALNKGSKYHRLQTWKNISRWTYGLNHLNEEFEWSELEEKTTDEYINALKTICAVNLKKTAGGNTTNEKVLSETFKNNADLIIQQVDLYEPELVIFCGSSVAYNYINALPEDRIPDKKHPLMTSRGIEYYKEDYNEFKRIYVSYMHPMARVSPCVLYYGLTDAVKEIMKKEKDYFPQAEVSRNE